MHASIGGTFDPGSIFWAVESMLVVDLELDLHP